MKTIATILATMMLGTSIAACNLNVDGSFMGKPIKASDTFVTKEYKVTDFDKINLVGSGKVFFTQQPGAPAVSVVTSDNVAELLDVYVEDGMLQLKIKKGYSLNNIKKLDYTINAAALKAVSSQPGSRDSQDVSQDQPYLQSRSQDEPSSRVHRYT